MREMQTAKWAGRIARIALSLPALALLSLSCFHLARELVVPLGIEFGAPASKGPFAFCGRTTWFVFLYYGLFAFLIGLTVFKIFRARSTAHLLTGFVFSIALIFAYFLSIGGSFVVADVVTTGPIVEEACATIHAI